MEKPKYIYYEIHGQILDENLDPVHEINVMATEKDVAQQIASLLLVRNYDSTSLDVVGSMERLVL